MVTTTGTSRKVNAILSSFKINEPKLVHICGYKLANKSAKFHENILSLSENIAKSFRGGYFLRCSVIYVCVLACRVSKSWLQCCGRCLRAPVEKLRGHMPINTANLPVYLHNSSTCSCIFTEQSSINGVTLFSHACTTTTLSFNHPWTWYTDITWSVCGLENVKSTHPAGWHVGAFWWIPTYRRSTFKLAFHWLERQSVNSVR